MTDYAGVVCRVDSQVVTVAQRKVLASLPFLQEAN